MKIFFPAYMAEQISSTFSKIANKAGSSAKCVINDSLEKWVYPVSDDSTYKVAIISAEIDIPEICGWKVIAKLEDIGRGNVIQKFHDMDIPQKYWEGSGCDHCEVNRYRKETFLLFKDGEFKQVGSSCLNEFTGQGFDHLFFAGVQSLIKDCNEGCMSGKHRSYNMIEVLKAAQGIISAYGFVSAKAAEYGNLSTSSRVFKYLNPGYSKDYNVVISEDYSYVESALSWIRNLDSDQLSNEYYHNMFLVCKNDYVNDKYLGLVSSLLSAYGRHLEENKSKGNSEYVGKVGVRSDFELIYNRKSSFDSAYGIQFRYIFNDKDGNVFTWKTNSFFEFASGDKVCLKGTVKEHIEYKEVKQTVLTRCKVQLVIAPDV